MADSMETNVDHNIDHDLTDRLNASDATLPPELRDRVVAQGKAAVPTLLAMVQTDIDNPWSRWPWLHALTLLRDIQDPDTIEPLLEVLATQVVYAAEREPLLETLAAMGEHVLEPALHAYVTSGENLDIAMLLARLGVRDERVYEILIDMLPMDVELGARLLADYGDPRAVSALRKMFDFCTPCDEPARGVERALFAIDEALSRLGSELTTDQRAVFRRIDEAHHRRLAIAHERDKQIRKEHEVARRKQRSNIKKKRKQQKNSRKKNR